MTGKQEALARLRSARGHLAAVIRMVEEDTTTHPEGSGDGCAARPHPIIAEVSRP
jgi:hypothetical protein